MISVKIMGHAVVILLQIVIMNRSTIANEQQFTIANNLKYILLASEVATTAINATVATSNS